MPGKSRIIVPGLNHHVMARGLDRKSIFLDNEDLEEMVRLAYTVKELAEFLGVHASNGIRAMKGLS